MKNFKYHSTFATKHIRVIVPDDHDKQLALASLKDLKDVLPQGLDIGGNPDLVFHSFNAFLVNKVNLNDDGIRTQDAIAISNKFIHKPEDLEHNRKFVVGTIISQGYSEFLTNQMLTLEDVQNMTGPFNVTLGGVVWTMFNPDFAGELVESSDETSPKYELISASWEIGFNEAHIALGSKNLAEAEIITDPKQVEEFEKHLRIAKGSGKTADGVPVYRVITGEALPLGIGFTTTPAGDVRGVTVASEPKKDLTEAAQLRESLEILSKKFEEFSKGDLTTREVIESDTQQNTANSEKNNSQLQNITVKNNSIMKFETPADITEELFKDEAVAAKVQNFLGKYVSDKIDEVSTTYAEKLEAKEKEVKAQKEELEKSAKTLQDTLAEVEKVKEDLKKEQEVRATQKIEADFNSRMTDLDSAFNLEDKDRSYIAKDIKGLDDDAYASWFEKFEVFAAGKKKKAKMDAEDDPSKGGDSGADEDAEDAKKKKAAKAAAAVASAQELLDKAKEDAKSLIPNNTDTETSLKSEFADAFKLEDFKIKK